MKQSAGTLLFRWTPTGAEVLLVHPSGNYNRQAPWSIPKGEPEANESLEQAARRETLEETGVEASGLVPLGAIQYRKSRKQVHCFAGAAPSSVEPHPVSWENDRAEFLPWERARQWIHPDQAELLDRLAAMWQRGSEGDED